MSVLIVKNIKAEGPGTIGEYLSETSERYVIIEAGEGQLIPSHEAYDTLVMLGGPMGVYEMSKYPHLSGCVDSIREFMAHNKRVLGVCLGAQLMAHTLGAKVYKGTSGQEKGWMNISLTDEGRIDKTSKALGEGSLKVLQWHGDTFDIPTGAVRLAGSKKYRNQAFRQGPGAYALQFHIEVTEPMLHDWFGDNPDIIRQTELYLPSCKDRAYGFYREFFLKKYLKSTLVDK